ncbi:cGMP-dependent protein kinase 1 isoform X2 [Gasterosteus aculeatus]
MRRAKTQTDSKLGVIDRRSQSQTILRESGLKRPPHSMELLTSIPFLQSLPDHVIMKASALMKQTRYTGGDDILRQGATGDKFYILSKGQVKVTERKPGHAQQIVLCELSERQRFGEEALSGAFRDVIDGLVFDSSREVRHRPESKIESERDADLFSSPTISDFQIICTVAVGEFGHVDLVQVKSNIKCLYATRVLKNKLILSNIQQQHILREERTLTEAHCPFIARDQPLRETGLEKWGQGHAEAQSVII